MTTKDVHFFWVPGTGESYKDDLRTDVVATNSMGSAIAAALGERVQSHWVGYDSTYGPVGGDPILGQGHYDSRQIGKDAMLDKARATTGYIIFGGYSQGAGCSWEIMQEMHKGLHPDLWDRVIAFIHVANPYRQAGPIANRTTLTLDNTLPHLRPGWGVANRLGSGIHTRIPEFDVVNLDDGICNARSNSYLREVADLSDFFEVGKLVQWGRFILRDFLSFNWVGEALANWTDLSQNVPRFVNTLKELEGFVATGMHVGYGDATAYPQDLPLGGVGSMTTRVGQLVDSYIPALITGIPNRGPNPPVIATEDFSVAGAGWTNFFSGNLSAARVANGRAGLIATGANVVANAHGLYSTPFPSDNGTLTLTLGDVLQGTLDQGSNGSPLYVRVRSQDVFGVGTCVEFRVRANGTLAISSVNGTTVTQRAGNSGNTYSLGHDITFGFDGNLYYIKNETTGVIMISWTDAGNIATVGASNRHWGMSELSNHPPFQPQWSSYTVDSMVMKEIIA